MKQAEPIDIEKKSKQTAIFVGDAPINPATAVLIGGGVIDKIWFICIFVIKKTWRPEWFGRQIPRIQVYFIQAAPTQKPAIRGWAIARR